MADPRLSAGRCPGRLRRRRTARAWRAGRSRIYSPGRRVAPADRRLGPADGDIGGGRLRRRHHLHSARRAGRSDRRGDCCRRPRPGGARRRPVRDGRRDQCVDDGCALWHGRPRRLYSSRAARAGARRLARTGRARDRRHLSPRAVVTFRSSQGLVERRVGTGARDSRARSISGRAPIHVRATLFAGWPGTAASGARHFCGRRGARHDPEPASPPRRFN